LQYSEYTRLNGALPSKQDHNLAVFATYEEGQKAIYRYLFETDYRYLKVVEAIRRFAPKDDGYSPDKYLAYIVKNSKIDATKTLGDLSESDRQNVLELIKQYENFTEGKVTLFTDSMDYNARGW
jgi:hypothetical protein